MSDQPDPNLLKKAVDDREAHPWRYYRLDHDVMKRMLDQLAERAERAEAQPAAAPRPASAALRDLIAQWRHTAAVEREAAKGQAQREVDLLGTSADTWDICADELAAALARAEQP